MKSIVIHYMEGVAIAAFPWLAYYLLWQDGLVSTFISIALAMTGATYLILKNGGLAVSDREGCHIRVWLAIFGVLAVSSVAVFAVCGELLRWLMLLASSCLNELCFRGYLLFDKEIADGPSSFSKRAALQAVIWAAMLCVEQFLSGAMLSELLVLLGGYVATGIAFAYLVRKSGTILSAGAIAAVLAILQMSFG